MSITSGDSPISQPLTLFLVQLIVVVTLCRILSYLFRFIKEPPVVAEVITGILLGPTALGKIPNFSSTLFPESSLTTFNVFANFGLILFMFIVGLEINTKMMLRNLKKSIAISITAILVPFCLGIASSYVIYTTVATASNFGNFLAFVGVALSITAFPVLARIITERKLIHTTVGSVALSAAAVDDVVAWCILAVVVSVARAENMLSALWTFLILLAFVGFMLFITRPLLSRIANNRRKNSKVRLNVVVLLLILIFVCAWFTEIIGVHTIFGAFVLGIVTPRRNNFAVKLTNRIEDLVVVLLLPLFFTYSGLRTDATKLGDITSWALVLLVTATACVGKIGGATIAAKVTKNTWRDSFTIGILMNTKGLVELIVLNIGLDIGVLNTKVFTIFVLMAIITTLMTTPLVWLIYERKRDERGHEGGTPEMSILMHISNSKASKWMANVAQLFAVKDKKFMLRPLIVKEISDRPSSYFFADIYHKPATKHRSKSALADLRTWLEAHQLPYEMKTFISADIPTDLEVYVNERDFSLVMFELKQAMEPTPLSPRQSFITRGFETMDKMFDWSSADARTVSHAISSINAAIAVIIDKHETFPSKIDSILFFWMEKDYEAHALQMVLNVTQMAPQIRVTVVSKSIDFQATHNVTNPNVTVIHVDSEDKIEIPEEHYDIIILGADRKNKDIYHSDVIHNCSMPVLLLYGYTTKYAKKRDKKAHV